MTADRPVVAAFDFDGTLTARDTFVGFLAEIAGRTALATTVVRELVPLARMTIGRSSRDRTRDGSRDGLRDDLKARFVRHLLAGRDEATVRRAGADYGRRLVDELVPSTRARLDHHRRRGDTTLIVSASLDVYLEVVAEELGIDGLACTRLEVVDGQVTGELAGPNCRGEEKVMRLRQLTADLGVADAELWAYGDSAGDDAMLATADRAFRVRRGKIKVWDGRGR